MASTRSPSPAEGVSAPTSPLLSPRSKIKALLATVNDADSDDDSSPAINTNILSKSIDKSIIANTESHSIQDEDEEEDSDAEEEIVRPRGRLAARMRAMDIDTTNDTTPKTSIEPAQPHTTSTNNNKNKESVNADNDDDDHDDVTILPRRRLARPIRSSTPEVASNTDIPPSPGLFVTPAPETPRVPRQSGTGAESDTDDELPANLGENERFLALVARKRQERLAREAEEERKRKERAERIGQQMPTESDVDDDVSDVTDDDGGRKLTQEVSRPSRKASKKALEEMNRETQRLSRSLQLAHEAKTKKKITKASLFERFNFRTEAVTAESKPTSSSRPTTPGSVQQTDIDMADAGTPPSSPPLAPKTTETHVATPTAPNTYIDPDDVFRNDGELPSLEVALAQSQKDKGKGKAVDISDKPAETKGTGTGKPKRQIRVKLPPMQANLVTIESDDELEITKSKKGRIDAIFDKLPEKKTQESKSIDVLRRLAHLSSPPRETSRGRKTKPSMTPAELQMTLQQRARAQAKLERERRLEYLKSKGITVQTEEERQREREQVEDIVARARQEAEEIMQREREDAKKARKEGKKNGESDPLAWDDSDDDSFEDTGDEDPAEIELSGSEEENEVDDDDNEDEDEHAKNLMFEDEAEEDDDSEEEEHTPKATASVASDDEADVELPPAKFRRSKKHVTVVSDDEDDVEATPKSKAHPRSPSATNSSPKIPTSVLRSARKTFIPGLPVPAAGPAGMGLTQIFAGTMDDSQVGPASGSPQKFMPSLDNFPDSQFSATAGQSQSQDNMVLDSQKLQKMDTQPLETQTQGVQLHFSQSQLHGFDTLMQIDGTQASDLIEPTQDAGFQDFSPLKQRFVDAPGSTVDTVLLGGTPDYDKIEESPLVRRTGRLRQRGESIASISTLTSATNIPASPSAGPSTLPRDAEADANAFRLMQKAARRKKRMQEKFDKKKSKASEMIEEQAEESEDEYAGLGGADGEDSSEEDDELVKEMIDDAVANNNADVAKLASFFADRERAADAAQVDKLFRDITTGMLRKRRRGGDNNDFDLSDSDDGGEARRRMKRRQFAKMQKALFADERIEKIAENPRNAAFLKSIEDRNSDDEWDFGENFADGGPESADSDSQSQNQGQDKSAAERSIPNSQPTNGDRKRTHADDHVARPPPNARRTRGGVRPSSITDVRRELSDLLDEPNGSSMSVIPATEIGSDGEDEERPTTSSSNKENRQSEVTVVDRIKLKRDSSSVSTGSNGGAGSSRLAFAAPSASGSSGLFKVPALLRRATTNSLMSNSSTSTTSSSSAPTAAGSLAGGDDGKLLKKTAGKRSGINYFARENERRAAVAEAEKRREAKKWKGAEGRSKVVGGLFGGGKFE
ncbi:MRC1-like domain-containing protein [Daldinia caldariorum]|uniref:MRC1-like domain-containing protein n=1 Tax=Daldinia caldariorum TaxID=326644 RepID=UPI0020074544|nr:MRC1-like domain-containing protein [Daldinia caldariorum]KAI1463882.1 MRC1-like domain-containing protein [Daldinia caldariorum]